MTKLSLALIACVAFAACKRHVIDVDPVDTAEATEFAHRFAALALPCDPVKLDELVDEDALAAKFVEQTSATGASIAADRLVDEHTGASVVCAGNAHAVAYKLLHVRDVAGDPRPVMRRLVTAPRTGVVAVAYDELQLGKSRRDHRVRVIDIYYYLAGQTLSEMLSGVTDAVASSHGGDTLDLVQQIQAARTLQQSGKFSEALAKLDGLPQDVRNSRALAIMRVNVANGLSVDAYRRALDDVARSFPNDPTIAMLEIDGATLRGDYTAALANIDIVDRAVGGDPFQNAVRAEILLKRGTVDDLHRAGELADALIRDEPDLKKAWYTQLDVTVALRDWTKAVGALDHLRTAFAVRINEDKLRALPGNYAELLATPEYASWNASSR
ncbi:MAG TPA: hypothetical protein VH143_31660 [Kofleriaceae bacterium]|nr:hypothetical protein [Kofleriaceae bacterium]